jgi:ankyrin repeat protein
MANEDTGRVEREMRDQLFAAIRAGERAQVEALLAERPALAETRNDLGVSAPLYSLYVNEPEIAKVLADRVRDLSVFEAAALGRGEALLGLLASDPALANAVAPDGFSPLGLAVFFGQRDAGRALLAAGANPSAPSRNAMRVAPLHSAVAAQRVDIAADLLRHGAEVNATQADDYTPLHEAAQNGQMEMIALLLQHGADTRARLSDGRTPRELAEAHSKSAAAARLRVHEATH